MSLEDEVKRYHRLAHSLQAAVKYKYSFDVNRNKVKSVDSVEDMRHEYHAALLRVGANMALVELGAVVKIMISKGIITEEEYMKMANDELEREINKYKDEISQLMGGIKIEFHGMGGFEDDAGSKD
jgi:hypothetical protein